MIPSRVRAGDEARSDPKFGYPAVASELGVLGLDVVREDEPSEVVRSAMRLRGRGQAPSRAVT